MNLKDETIECIATFGYNPKQIIFIGSQRSGYQCSWEEFCILANREYDNGYGGREVCSDLSIVFDDGAIMNRGEYDGSEWWEINRPFKMPDELKPIRKLFNEGYRYSLREMNDSDED